MWKRCKFELVSCWPSPEANPHNRFVFASQFYTIYCVVCRGHKLVGYEWLSQYYSVHVRTRKRKIDSTRAQRGDDSLDATQIREYGAVNCRFWWWRRRRMHNVLENFSWISISFFTCVISARNKIYLLPHPNENDNWEKSLLMLWRGNSARVAATAQCRAIRLNKISPITFLAIPECALRKQPVSVMRIFDAWLSSHSRISHWFAHTE